MVTKDKNSHLTLHYIDLRIFTCRPMSRNAELSIKENENREQILRVADDDTESPDKIVLYIFNFVLKL